jgi:ATP-dependent RNA helicase DHX29
MPYKAVWGEPRIDVNLHSIADPDSKPASSGLVTPNESETAETRLAQEQNATEPEVISDTDTHSDAELEPHELLSRYVSLKTRVYEQRPDLAYPESQKPKASKAKSKGAPQLDNSLDPKTRGLLRRLRKFRSDILFDLEEAEERWTETWVELVKETARRKRLGLDVDSIQAKQPAKPTTNHTAFTPDSTATPASEASNDADIDLGDLFVGLPDLGTDAENGKSVLSTSNADGTRVTIIDYGTWSGVGPRRVLEEACKAR